MVGKQYRILETLGKGAFGTVYRAEVLGAGDFKKQVALKVLDYSGDAPEEIALRFRDEARILGLIRHRAVVGVDSLAELETGWAVVMEYVEGVNVSAVVKYGLPPARVAVSIAEEVASALHAAYSAPTDEGEPLRLVHRDIKPANIRVTAQGEVKVLDFGVARAEFASREAHTQAMRFGSLRYMAPESFDGIEGHPTDIFALGIVFGELLAGKRLEEPPKNPERYPAFVDALVGLATARVGPALEKSQLDEVLALVATMIAFEPDDRPTAREVERACRSLASKLPDATLRDWAEDHVPALHGRMKRRMAQAGESSSILVEKTQHMNLDVSDLTATAPVGTGGTQTTATATFAPMIGGALGALMAILIVMFLFVFALWPALNPAPAEPVEAPAPTAVVAPDPVPAPEPVPIPPPVAPVAAPAASPSPVVVKPVVEPRPAPRPRGGQVNISGDAESVQLVSSSGAFDAGWVPPGTYRVMARFQPDAEAIQAGTVTLREGDDVTINCIGIMMRCSVK
jgi:serine/threonine-protein kinase